MPPDCPECGAELADAKEAVPEEAIPEGVEVTDDWFCEFCGGVFNDDDL